MAIHPRLNKKFRKRVAPGSLKRLDARVIKLIRGTPPRNMGDIQIMLILDENKQDKVSPAEDKRGCDCSVQCVCQLEDKGTLEPTEVRAGWEDYDQSNDGRNKYKVHIERNKDHKYHIFNMWTQNLAEQLEF